MALVYFDASAFVKLLVEEDGTDLAVELWDGCDAAVSSRLSYPEVRAAIAAATRDGRIERRHLGALEREWDLYWSAVRPVELSEAIARTAGILCRDHGVRGADGVHLSSAGAVAGADCLFAAWDHRLAAGAIECGLRVVPARS